MAGSLSVLTDDSLLSRIDRRFYVFEKAIGFLSGAAVLALMFLAVISVGGRNFFNMPLPGYVDWMELAMPLIAFLGISYAMRDGGHIRMDILIGQLQGRKLWMAEFVTTFATLVLIVLLIWGSWAHFGRSFDCSRPLCSADSTIDIGIPLWPAKLLVPASFSVLALRLVLQLWGYARAISEGTDQPVAVPLVKSAAELAQEEAEHVQGASGEGRS
ncbi:C4-dicarboxylate ABC transporter permease [Oceanicola sp. 22II-s10i]|uniref:TRAP transporter small permease subunit n=1 Tax=Oceanicola sp. 22II-s10i TaxID=1317116 RepID=UPI000B523EFF|nr:TRAP transporter small permease [Oceanicola sp. 22II-s10i]OWU82870.1 C4-dicarboxylate ABC transporter permease [Oceanicola sp. 22II-s10i]